MSGENSSSDRTPGVKEPERTCAACGKKSVKDDFLRFVYSPEGRLICDVRKKLQSRGVYVCPEKDCIKKALKKKAFSRFLKIEGVEPSLGELAENIGESLEGYLFGLMKMAFKSGKLKSGASAVFDAADKGNARLFMISGDAGRSVREKIEYLNRERGIDMVMIPDKLLIAEKMCKAVTAVMAVTDGGFAESLKKGWRMREEVKTW